MIAYEYVTRRKQLKKTARRREKQARQQVILDGIEQPAPGDVIEVPWQSSASEGNDEGQEPGPPPNTKLCRTAWAKHRLRLVPVLRLTNHSGEG